MFNDVPMEWFFYLFIGALVLIGATFLGTEDAQKRSNKPYSKSYWITGLILISVFGAILLLAILVNISDRVEALQYIGTFTTYGMLIAGATLLGIEDQKRRKNDPYSHSRWRTGIILLSISVSIFVIYCLAGFIWYLFFNPNRIK